MSTQSVEYLELEAKVIGARDKLKEMQDEMQLSAYGCVDLNHPDGQKYYTGQVDGLKKSIAVIDQEVLDQ